ncbi:MAG: chemotaxis protein CheB [Acidobacteriales bacterium]|nr:chemotaxis protein CheB [Terriglobales bacterium]
MHDIIVIGASAGGVDALMRVVKALPLQLSASIFIVLHTSPTSPGSLDKVLNRVDGNRALYARDGMKFESNKFYIAPPDRHMSLEADRVRVTLGPKQNRVRPSVDQLFRSAAAAFGERVIGVVLTGYLDDGASGLAAIKEAGGVAIVQDPIDAEVPGMPAEALSRANPDYCLRLEEVPKILTSLVNGSLHGNRGEMKNKRNGKPKRQSATGARSRLRQEPGPTRDLTALTCPDCHGAIWEVRDGEVVQFECRVAHTYSPESMYDAQADSVERALWAALKNLEESVALSRRLAQYSRERDRGKAADVYERQVKDKEQHAIVLRALLDGKSSEMIKGLDSAERERATRIVKDEAAA